MNKNMKQLFFFTTLLVLLVGLTALSATDVSDNNTVPDTQLQAPSTSSIDNVETVQQDDNKIVQSTENSVKEVKTVKSDERSLSKDSSQVDYYVSNSGRDTNTGTKDKPYKTINKALTQVKTNNTYNIHLAGGTYKGTGNTNLTVNGSYNINFIGDGMNKTVIDGDGKYTITPNPGYVWYSTDVWWPYIGSGNYGMTITKGSGHISISNLSISHMWCSGGSSISAYEHAPVDNYGNLSVDGVNFYYNNAGVGSAIRNNHDATLMVNNSYFESNRKSTSTGNDGIIYNNGTAEIYNSLFDKNYARWGTILNDHHLTIVNSTLSNGVGYDGGSTYKFGSGICANSDHADFYNIGSITDVVTNIINCTFIGNEQTDIYSGDGILFVNGSVFNHSTGIFISSDGNQLANKSVGIYNSVFNDMRSSDLFTSLSVSSGTVFAINSNTNRECIIENNIVSNTSSGYGFYVKGNSIIRNNTLTRYITVTGDNNTITGNTINNTDTYSIELVGSAKGNIVSNNTLYSQVFTGNKAVLYTDGRRSNNTVLNNIPVTGIYVNLTDSNYNTYFDTNGVMKTDVIENGSTITITGDLINKNMTFSNTKVALQGQASIINGSINIINNSAIIVNNTSIIDSGDKNRYAIFISSDGSRLSNNRILINTSVPVNSIIINGNKNILENNNINITTTADNIGVVVNEKDNTLYNNTLRIKVNSNNVTSTGVFFNSTGSNVMESNYVVINSTGNSTGYKIINTNDINSKNDVFSIHNAYNAVGYELTDSGNNRIQSGGTINNVTNAYGVILKGDKSKNTNNLFSGSTNINADNAYGVQVLNASNTNISSTAEIITHTITANNARGILTNNTENITIFYQRFYLTTQDNKTTPDQVAIEQINSVNTNITSVEMIRTTYNAKLMNNQSVFVKLVNTNNTTIKSDEDVSKTKIILNKTAVIMENSNNNKINDISIYTKSNNTIELNNSNNNTITDNMLNGNDIDGGDQSVLEINSKNNIIENNTHNISVIITDNNYNHYFVNNTFIIKGVLTAEIGSDLYNKTMIFPNTITIDNPGNYTIYNGSITLSNSTERSSLNNLRFNITDEREYAIKITAPVVEESKQLTIHNCSIIQSNNQKVAHTIYVTENTSISINNINITLNAPETDSDNLEEISSALYSKYYTSIEWANIKINTTKTLANGKIIGIINTRFVYANLTINTKNDAIALLNYNGGGSDTHDSNITITSNNKATGVLIFNSSTPIYRNNIIINAKNSTPLHVIESNGYNILYNNITSTETTQIIFNNTNNMTFRYNNVTVTDQETPLITIENSNRTTIEQNALITKNLPGDSTVKTINSTNNNIKFNTPGLIITNENYNQYFTNQTLNPQISTVIILGSDIYNKNMTFNTLIQILNPNNYTIYNGTITLTQNATSLFNVPTGYLIDVQYNSQIDNVNINNTDDRQSSIIVYANGTEINGCTIYQENRNNDARVIIADNVKIFSFINNKIITRGKNVTILDVKKLESQSTKNAEVLIENRITNNKFNIKADNTTVIKVSNSSLRRYMITSNNIKIETDNPTTAIKIDNTQTIYIQKNEIIIKTNNTKTPVINTTNTTGTITNNYIESYDTIGNNAIKTTGGKVTTRNNNPTNGKNYEENIEVTMPDDITINNTYPVTINITNKMDEPLNGTITIKIDNNSSTQTLENGITTINFTTPTPGKHTITITYPANGKYKQSSETITINVRKYQTTTTIEPVNTTIYENINLVAKITDENGNNVNGGQVIFLVNGTELKDENGNIIYVDVTNGSAILKVDVPLGWVNINNTGVQYTGNNVYESSNTTSLIKVNRLDANMKVEILNSNIRPGETAIIMVTVTDKNGNMIKSGKVIFKLNGKTIKDANGSTITIRIHNGIAIFKYRIPANYSAKNYTLTAVSVGNTYNRVETTTNITLTKINTYIQNVNTYFTGNTLHVKASIISTTTQEHVAYRTTKVSIKINNKTFAKEAVITNGSIDLNIDTSSIGRGNYKITIKAGENGIYKGTTLDTYTYKQSVKQALNQTNSNGTLVKT